MSAPVVEHRPALHSATLVGIAQQGIDNVITFAKDLEEAKRMLTDLRVRLGDVHAVDLAAIQRGRRSERHDDMQALRNEIAAAVRHA